MKIIPLDNCYEAHQKNIYATIYIDTEKKNCLMPDLFRYNDVLRELNILGRVVVFPVHF